MKRIFNWRFLALTFIGAVAILGLVFLPHRAYLTQFIDWVQDLGIWGPVLLALVYIPACIFFVPGSLLTLGAGYAFGLPTGTLAVSVGSTLGATAAFLAGRTFARSLIEEKIKNHPRFHALDQAVAQEGFKIVLLTRLSPIFPFNLLNYAFGLTRVRLRDYVLASWIGMLPGTVMYVYLGSAAGTLSAIVAGRVESTPAQQTLFVAGLIATMVVTFYVTRLARKSLAKTALKDEEMKNDK